MSQANSDRHEWARVNDLRPGTIVTTDHGVSCVIMDKVVTLDDDDGYGMAATIIGPPTHQKIGHGITLRFDDRVKLRELPTEIREALQVVPRAPMKDDVVPRTDRDQRRFIDDELGLRVLLKHGKENIGTKTSTLLAFSLNDLERLQRILDQSQAVMQQAIETHDVLTAANVSDAKTLRERVELALADRNAERTRANELASLSAGTMPAWNPRLTARTPSIGRILAGRPVNEVVKSLWQALCDCEEVNAKQATEIDGIAALLGTEPGETPKQAAERVAAQLREQKMQATEAVAAQWKRVLDALGTVEAKKIDLLAVNEEDGPDWEGASHYAIRRAALRVIRERSEMNDAMWEVIGALASNGYGNTWTPKDAAQVASVIISKSREEQRDAEASDSASEATARLRQMGRRMWETIGHLRRTTNHKPSMIAPPIKQPAESLLDLFNTLGEWHSSVDKELCGLDDDDENIFERTANLTGRAHSYVHAMDLVVELGRAGFELIKQK